MKINEMYPKLARKKVASSSDEDSDEDSDEE